METTFRGDMTMAVEDNAMSPPIEARKPVVLSSLERVQRYGIECKGPFGDGICFRGGEWEVGGEYVQKLTVKNVSNRMRKIKYKLPETTYFAMVFPERIDLPPGMHVDIDVVFRPVHNEVYDDTIYFKNCEADDGGGFHVPCRALISTLQCRVPPGLDFGLCPTHETMRFVFQIENTGQVPAPFEWTVPEPFFLAPMSGVVPVGGAVPIEASIAPTDASVFVSLATCEVGKGVHATKPEPLLELRLSAIGRYTFIVPSQERVDFGALLVGQTEGNTQTLQLLNRSTVPATVTCRRVESDREPVFAVNPTEFVVPPQSEVPLTVSFAPVCSGAYTREKFAFSTPGGSHAEITVAGVAQAPTVSIYKAEDPSAHGFGVPNSINFRDVQVGQHASAALFLRNDSELPVRYCIMAELDGAFAFNQLRGVLPANLEEHVRIDFKPLSPANFYQRVFVLVENGLPLFVDLLGTGYIAPRGDIKEQRPFPLRHAHVQAWRNRCAAGLAEATPPQLQEALARDGVHSPLFASKGRAGTGLLEISSVDAPVTRSGESTRGQVSVATEFFLDPNAMAASNANASAVSRRSRLQSQDNSFLELSTPMQPVFLSEGMMDFGFVSARGSGERRSLIVTNTTHAKITVQWMVPPPEPELSAQAAAATSKGLPLPPSRPAERSLDYDDTPVPGTWDVLPREADIGPGQQREFKVVCHPQHTNAYFCRELEAVAYFKTQRTFRLVHDATLQPPWCLKVQAMAHSLTTEQFAAQVTLSSYRGVVEFPGTHVGDTTYQTIRVDNHSNLPAQFVFERPSSGSGGSDSAAFDVKPRAGLVPPGSFALVLCRFSPSSEGEFSHQLVCEVNHEPHQARTLRLKGTGSTPEVRVLECDSLRRALGLPSDAPSPPLYMKATCAGLVSTRTFTLQNPHRIPVVYAVEIPARLSGVFAMTPRSGLLRGNQSALLTLSFAPLEQHKDYKLKVVIKARATGGAPPPHLFGDARMIGDSVEPAAYVSEAVVTVLAPGSGAVVAFEPPHLDFGSLLVNNTSDASFTLVNASDCDVQYELHHRVAPEHKSGGKHRRNKASSVAPGSGNDNTDGNGTVATSSSSSSSSSSSAAASEKQYPPEGGLHPVPRARQPGAPAPNSSKPPPLLCIDRPRGVLPAHSRTLLRATFQPQRSGDFDLALCALVAAVDSETGLKVAMQAEESATIRVGDRARLVTLLCGIDENDPDFDENVPLPLAATCKGRASFPTAVVTDARCLGGGLGGSTRDLWNTLSLENMNTWLSESLTKQEVKANLSSSPNLENLPTFRLRFTPSPVGSEKCEIVLQFFNPGFLATKFEIHFPNEREVEVPQWADEGEPNEAQLMENRIIDELKSFEVYPKHGVLKPGEGAAITFSYKYDSLDYNGIHHLAIHFKVSQGKQFRFSLQGETLPLDACKLWQTVPPSPLATYRLMPVAIGTTLALAPLQSTELINTGAQDLSYAIHLGPLAASAQGTNAYGFQNLYLENPVGVIPGRSTHFLQWRFLPLEAREYTYALPITYRRSGNSSSGGGGGSHYRGEQSTGGSDRGSVRSNGGNGSRSARRGSTTGTQRRSSNASTSAGGSGVAAARAAAAGGGARAEEPPVFSETLCIAATGYDPREEDPHAETVPEIATGLVPPPYQLLSSGVGPRLAVLSLERLHLGRLPQRARRTELVVLRNPNPAAAPVIPANAAASSEAFTAAEGPFGGPGSNHNATGGTVALAAGAGEARAGGGGGGTAAGQAVDYAWDTMHPLVASGLLVITPMKGRIPAGGFATVTFSVVADCAPCIVDAQVAVHCCPAPEEEAIGNGRRGGTRGTSRGGGGGSTRGGGGGSRASLTGGDLATARSAAAGSAPPSPTGDNSGNPGAGAGAAGGGAAGQKGGVGVPDGRATIASRSTPSRNAMLEVTRARVENLTGRVPKLPTRPPTPPKTGDEDEEIEASGGSGGGNGTGRAASAAAPPASSSMSNGGGAATTARSMAAGATGRTSNNGSGSNGSPSQPGTFLHVFLWFEVVHEEAFVSLFKADVNAVRIPRPRKFIPGAPLPRDLDAPVSPPLPPGADTTAAASAVGDLKDAGVAAAERRASLRMTTATSGGDHGGGKNGGSAVVQHAHHLRSRSETATAVLSGFFGAIFADALESSEVRAAVLALPQQPKIPLYRDLKAKADLMLRLENAFKVFDTDNSGKLSTKEIKGACHTMGLKAKTKEAKAFMRALDEDQDGEVDLKEFLSASMPPEVSLALEEAIENMEHQAKLKRKEERRIARMFAVVQDSSMTADKAAMQIQGKFRKRQAAKRMALKKLLALNPEARAQNNAANLLQGQVRGRKARADAREKAELKTQVMRQLALGDPDFQGLIGNLMEDCVGNLVAEALHGEFDLGPPPKQYALATENYLNVDGDDDEDDESKVEHKAAR